jgi:hypothetical protein
LNFNETETVEEGIDEEQLESETEYDEVDGEDESKVV